MSVEYRNKLIRRAVDANTSPNVAATPLQARTLHKYFESPHCADIAYMKIIERGEWAVSGLAAPGAGGTIIGNPLLSGGVGSGTGTLSTTGDGTVNGFDNSSSGGTITGGPALGKIGAFHSSSVSGHRSSGVGDGGDKVLVKCVRLLKTYLLVYYPSDYVLVALDRFCFRMQAIFEEAAKSFEYVRALVEAISQSRHAPLSNASTPTPSNQIQSSIDTPPMSHPPASNHHHFNTAPSSALNSNMSHHTPLASNPLLTGSQLSPKSLHGSSNIPVPTTSAQAGQLGHSPGSNAIGSTTNGLSENPGLHTKLTANFVANRVRNFLADPLDSLLCSSIFGGRIPTALLDIFAERTEPVSKSGASSGSSGSSSTTGTVGGGTTGIGTASSGSGSTTGSTKLETGTTKKNVKSQQLSHAAQAYLFSLPDQDLRERIATVSLSKKMEERAMYRSFRRGQPLFQYKHYIEQVKLDLTASQIDAIVSTMIQSTNHESRLLASKIMIKLIMDMYCQDSIELASSSLLAILLELIQADQPIETKTHAFNLIFNLSTHLHMFEEVSFFGPATSSSSTTTNTATTIPPHTSPLTQPHHQTHPTLNLQGSTPTVSKIQNELFSIVKELLLALVQQRETSRKLWFSGLSCLLYFMTDTGHIEKEKLVGLDPRVIAAFFKNLDYINDSVWRHLVRILVNRLYLEPTNRSGKKALIPNHEFIAQILLLGQSPSTITSNGPESASQPPTPLTPSPNKEGIRFIVDLYKRSRSMESKDNLFHVIFDYIHYCYRRMIRAPPSSGTPSGIKVKGAGNEGKHVATGTQFSYILEILTRIDAPQYFASIFKYPPPNFVNHVVGLINHVANNAGPEFTQLLHQTDPIVLRRVLKDFAALADLSVRLSSPWAEDCMESLDDTANSALLSSSLKQITSMIQGKASLDASNHIAIQFERQHGCQWMLQLMQIVWNVRFGLANVPQVESRRHSLVPPLSPNGASSAVTGSIKGRARKESGSSAGGAATISTTSSHRRPSRDARDKEPHRTSSKETTTKDSKESETELSTASSSSSAASTATSTTTTSASTTTGTSTVGASGSELKDHSHKDSHHYHHYHHHKEHKDGSSSTYKDATHGTHKESSSSTHKDGHAALSHSAKATVTKHHVTSHLTIPTLTEAELASSSTAPQRLPTRGLHLRSADPSFVESVENTFWSHAKSPDPLVRRSFLKVVEAGMFYITCLSDQGASHIRGGSSSISPGNSGSIPRTSPRPTSVLLDADVLCKKSFEMMNLCFTKLIKLGQETFETNLLLMFDIIMHFVCLLPISNRIYVPSFPGSGSNPNLASSPATRLDEFPTSPKTRISATINPTFGTGGGGSSGAGGARNEAFSSQTMKPGGATSARVGTSTATGTIATGGAPHNNSAFTLSDSDDDDSLGSDDDMPFGSISGMRAAAEKREQQQQQQQQQQPPSPQLDRLMGDGAANGGGAGGASGGSRSGGLDMVDLNNQDDSPAGLFMRGKLDIVRPLLDLVDIEILLHIFNHLPPRMNSATRPVALHFLTERCKHNPADLDLVGGSSFFKKLLVENDPLISYLASRFLIDKLQKEQPENFNMVVNTLLAKAVDLNDEKLVSNPYLQIKAIFEMNSTLRRKEQGGLFPL